MFRIIHKASWALCGIAKQTAMPQAVAAAVGARGTHGEPKESWEMFDARYEKYLNRPEIDGWEVRKAINDLQGEDLVPEPHIISAVLRACRKVNDYAMAVRYLEAVKFKCGHNVNEFYPYIIENIRPTLDELGILTPEEMGYDKPELWKEDVYDM